MKHIVASLIGMISIALTPAQAATTDWVAVTGGAVRIISSGPLENGVYRAGLEFSLDPGWHTYWRFPGEAGIPPLLDFSQSENLGKVDVKYPVPGRYSDGFSTSIVYDENIVLPLLVTPAQADKPIEFHTSLFFGLCKEICVPGEAVFKVTLQPDNSADKLSRLLIERDLALVPKQVGSDASRIVSITSLAGDKGQILRIEAEVDPATQRPELFAEGPEGSFIGVPVLISRDSHTAVWTLPTNGLARTENGTTLTLVLVDGDTALESRHDLPSSLLN